MKPESPYRPCVGITLFNSEGLVFLGERADNPGFWQMPQGGIDPGESVEQAIFRELKEETGVTSARIIKIHDEKLRYSIPEKTLKKMNLWDGKYKGQEQTWAALRFTGNDDEINLFSCPPAEFSDWRWVKLARVIDFAVPFKKDTYTKVIESFREFSV